MTAIDTQPSPTYRGAEGQLLSRSVVRSAVLLTLVVLLLVQTGCGKKKLREQYGRVKSLHNGTSIAGLSLLGALFEERGAVVKSAQSMAKGAKWDVVVWAPDGFAPPSRGARDTLAEWLGAKRNRTLIIVGRDWDPYSHYWATLLETAPVKQHSDIQRKLAFSKSVHQTRRDAQTQPTYAHWFVSDPRPTKKVVDSLEGEWASQLDPAKLNLELHTRWRRPTNAEVPVAENDIPLTKEPLLTSDGDWIVARLTDRFEFGGSQILAVTNGAPLLNVNLVNPEHQKLARLIVDECNRTKKVLFLEGVEVRVYDENDRMTGFEHMTTEPINVLIMHLMVLGIVWWFVFFPIFGRARDKPSPAQRKEETPGWMADEQTSDFGKHIDALAAILQRAGERRYAQSALEHYHRLTQRDKNE